MKFLFGDKVRVVDGFYQGQVGTAIGYKKVIISDSELYINYEIIIKDKYLVIIAENELEKMEE